MIPVPTLVMTTGVSPVPGGGTTPGWVSGTIASLFAGANATIIFDLGPEWDRYTVLQAHVQPAGPSSGLSNVQFQGNSSTAVPTGRQLQQIGGAAGSIIFASLTSAGAFMMRPCGRFVIMRCTNADGLNDQGATATVTLAAYPT